MYRVGKFVKSIGLFLNVSFLYLCMLYCVVWKYTIGILWHDIETFFEHCSSREIVYIFVPIILFVLLFLILAVKKNAYTLEVQIQFRSKSRKIYLCYLHFFHKYAVWMCLIITMISAVVGVKLIAKDKKFESREYLISPMVIHAMGEINGHAYSNSKEAFLQHYAKGQRVFETDFCLTSDGQMVARHDWSAGWQEGIDEEHVPTEDVFKQQLIYGEYTPLSLRDIIMLMQEYQDVYILTDTKDEQSDLAREEISILVNTAKEMQAEDVLDRFIIQIYSPSMYEGIKDLYDFPNYVFTLYMIWTRDETEFINYCRFCRSNGIKTITMWDYRLIDNPKLAEIAGSYEIEIFVHTVNDKAVAEEVINLGASGIYTDNEEIFMQSKIFDDKGGY